MSSGPAVTPAVGDLPRGTVIVLASQVEAHAALWEQAGRTAATALDRQHDLICSAVASRGGLLVEVSAGRESMLAVFASAGDAVAAALDAQLDLRAEGWPAGTEPRVRVAVHTGEARLHNDERYSGMAVQRCIGLRDIAHGGQILLSAVTAALVTDALPDGSWLTDRGEHRLKDLSRPERVFELGHPGLGVDPRPLLSLDALPNNLPAQLTSFVGRGRELADIAGIVTAERMVTLTGSGGCGKTRLAAQTAAARADRWPDGVWWVDLASVADPSLVADLVATTMRVRAAPVSGPLDALRMQLRDRSALVCLDNCEHLMDAVAGLVDELLRHCTGLTLLATSREPLGVAGEVVWRVPSMAEDEAVRLFAARAGNVRPGFTVTPDNAAAVHTICRRLDGIPLALELAAGWVPVLSPAQIADGLDDRFRLLTGGPRGTMARQQTLAASVDWSYDLLDEPDQVAFRRLSVLTGGFTLAAAHAVYGGDPVDEADVLITLGRLVDKSLVLADDSVRGELRYRMLETVRQFAQERLHAHGQTAAVRDRHLDHYLALAQHAEPQLDRDQDNWRGILEREHDNMRAALRWGLSLPDPERGRRLAAALARFWNLHGHIEEGSALLDEAIGRAPGSRTQVQGRLLCGRALLTLGNGRPQQTADAAVAALELATENGDSGTRARSLALSCYLPFFTDFPAAEQICVEARALAETAGDLFAADFATVMQACSLTNWDLHDEAVALARPVAESCLPRGERFCAAVARACEVWAALITGDPRGAREAAIASLAVAEPLGDVFTVGLMQFNLAWANGLVGDLDAGCRVMAQVVRAVADAGTEGELVPWLALMPGKLSLWAGDLGDAERRLTQATRFAEPMTDNWVVVRALPALATTLRRLGRLDESCTHAGRAISLARHLGVPHVLAEALDESGHLAAIDDLARAEDLHLRALDVRVKHGLRTFLPDSLDALAGTAARTGRADRAARLFAAADRAREQMSCPRPPVANVDATIAAVRSELGDEAYAIAFTEGRAMSLDEAVAYAGRARPRRARPASGWAGLTPVELEVVRLATAGHATLKSAPGCS